MLVGHEHQTLYTQVDENNIVMESGCYMHNIGLLDFQLINVETNQTTSTRLQVDYHKLIQASMAVRCGGGDDDVS